MIPPRRAGLTAGIAMAVAFAAFLPFLRGTLAGNCFYFRDISREFFPLRRYALEGLRQGELRYWIPLVHEGSPAPFPPLSYPLDLLQLLAPDERGLSLHLALHVPLAALAFMVLARNLGVGLGSAAGGALAYALGGFCLSMLNFYVYLHAMAWAPLVVAALRWGAGPARHGVAAIALASGMCLSTGGIEIAAQAILAGIVLALPGRRREVMGAALRMAAGIALGLGLAAPTVLAMAGVVAQSARGSGFPTDVALAQSIHPLTWLQVVIGSLYGDLRDLTNRWWGENFFPRGFPYVLSLYLGAMVMALTLTGARRGDGPRWRLVGLALIAAAVCLGRWAGLEPVVEALSWIRKFRFPVKAFFTVHLSVAALVTLGLEAMWRGTRGAWRTVAVASLVSGGLLAAAPVLPRLLPEPTRWFAWGFMPWGYTWATRHDRLHQMLGDAAIGGALALAAGVLALLVLVGRLGARLAVAGYVLLVAADLLRTGAGLNPMVTRAFYELAPPVRTQLEGSGRQVRVFTCDPTQTSAYWSARRPRRYDHDVWTFEIHRQTLMPFFNVADGIATAYSEDLTGLVPRELVLPPDATCAAFGGLVDRLRDGAVSHVVAVTPLDHPGLRLVSVTSPPRIAPLSVYLYELGDPHPRFSALVPPMAGGPAPPVPTLLASRAGYTELLVTANQATTVVVRDGYSPGWHARVDGVPSPVIRWQSAHLAVPVATGIHRLELRYRPPGLRQGLALMAVAAAILGLLNLPRRRGGGH